LVCVRERGEKRGKRGGLIIGVFKKARPLCYILPS